MIRGAQKKMIVIRTHDSRVFEEAYFVMRRDTEASVGDSDMLTEADRIIRRHTAGAERPLHQGRSRVRERVRYLLWLGLGLLLGSGGTGLLMWLL